MNNIFEELKEMHHGNECASEAYKEALLNINSRLEKLEAKTTLGEIIEHIYADINQ